MRILYVLSKLEHRWRGGIGRVTSGAAKALAARGHAIHFAGRARDGGPPEPVDDVVIHPWPARIGHVGQLPFLLALQRRIRADVIHFHASQPHGAVILPMRAVRWAFDRPALVATPHTGSQGHYPRRLGRAALPALDAIVAPTAWSAERAIEAGAPSDRVHVVWNGVDRVIRRDPEQQRAVIFALGRIVTSKGFDVLMQAFDRIASERPNWQLVVAGEGRELRRLRKLAGRLRNGGRIFLPGHVSGEQKERLFREASIGVVPSRKDMIPGAMLELQARGIPIIASDVGAIAEGAASGQAARLVPPDDLDALATALARLMDHPEERRQLGEGALAVSQERVWPRIAEQLESLYWNLLPHAHTAAEPEENAAQRAET